MIIPSVWSSYFIDLSPEDMVKVFSGKAWFSSELSDEHASVLLERAPGESAGKQFKKYADEHGIMFPQGHLCLRCDIAALNQKDIIDKLKSWLDLFYTVGIRNAVLHPGGNEMIEAGYDTNDIMTARVFALRELAGHIRGTGMTICLENIFTTSPECDDLLQIIKSAGCSDIGICLDTGHLNLCSGDQTGFIRKSGSYLKALHIADNEGAFDQHLMPYGRGTISWNKLITSLKENKYSGLFNMEIPGERDCPLPIRMAKLDYIKYMISFLLSEY